MEQRNDTVPTLELKGPTEHLFKGEIVRDVALIGYAVPSPAAAWHVTLRLGLEPYGTAYGPPPPNKGRRFKPANELASCQLRTLV